MKLKLCLLAAGCVLLASPMAFAQNTCAEAVTLTTPNDSNEFPGDTTTGVADIDKVGPLGLNGAKSHKYKFVAGDTVDGTLTLTGASFNWAIYTAKNCQASSTLIDAIAHNDATTVLPLSRSAYPAGSTIYVIVSDSSGDGSADDAGPYTLVVTPNLPVTLQNFSID